MSKEKVKAVRVELKEAKSDMTNAKKGFKESSKAFMSDPSMDIKKSMGEDIKNFMSASKKFDKLNDKLSKLTGE